MIQNLSSIGQQFLANLSILQQQIANTQSQMSSGQRINQVSDDPAGAADVLQLESQLGNVNQTISNLSQVTGQVNMAESSLQSATQLMDQITSLGTQGANSTASAATRASLAQQVAESLSQMVSLSQTQFDGAYVFSGDNATQASYQLDSSSPTGVDRLIQSTSTRVIQDSTGITFADARSAQDIFDHRNPDDSVASDNVFAAINSLQTALANNDTAGITSALQSVKNSSAYLSNQLAFYGGVQDQIQNATTIAQKFQVQYQTAIGNERNANVAQEAVQLTQEQTTLQASLQAEAAVPKTSLFDVVNFSGNG